MNQLQMISVIQCYIHHVKNIQVKINPPRNIQEVFLMQQMYSIAESFLKF